MNTVTTLVAKQPASERAIAARFGYAADYSVFTAPVGACSFDTSDNCMRVEIAARQLDVLVAGALSQRSKLWGTREDTEYRLYDYMSNLAGSGGYWLTKPEGVQDILMSIGAESDEALAVGTELGEWNLQLTARRPQSNADYATYSAEARGYTPLEALNTYFFNADACEPSPCQNGAECVDLAALEEYQCLCPAGFTGSECQTETQTALSAFTGYAFGPYGPYQGCQVFIDLNGNKIWDAGEPKETTDALGVDTEGRFTFQNLDTRVAPLMRVIMIPSPPTLSSPGRISAVVSPYASECPYLETVVPVTDASASSTWSTGAQRLGSSANPIAMSDLTTLQLYRATRTPPGNPVATQGIGSRYSNAGGWQTEILTALDINVAFKPFEIRCNYIRGQGPEYQRLSETTTCQSAAGDAVFSALLALHTVFRVGLAQKQASLSVTNAQSLMIAKLAQVSIEYAAHARIGR
jgi:hypothetical protein